MDQRPGAGRRDMLQATGMAMLASLAAGSAAAATADTGGLRDVDIIRNRIGQYPYFFDNHEPDNLAGLFWPDATLKVNMEPGEQVGREAIRAWYMNMAKGLLRSAIGERRNEIRMYHVLFNHVIEIDGAQATAATDYFSLDIARNPATNESPLPLATCSFHTCGRFRFWFEKRQADWRYRRLEIDIFAGEPA